MNAFNSPHISNKQGKKNNKRGDEGLKGQCDGSMTEWSALKLCTMCTAPSSTPSNCMLYTRLAFAAHYHFTKFTWTVDTPNGNSLLRIHSEVKMHHTFKLFKEKTKHRCFSQSPLFHEKAECAAMVTKHSRNTAASSWGCVLLSTVWKQSTKLLATHYSKSNASNPALAETEH